MVVIFYNIFCLKINQNNIFYFKKIILNIIKTI
jgi:hypothetical protein